MNEQNLRDFEQYLAEQIPGFRVQYKNDSKLMKFLGFMIGPFNNEFMSGYITTWGNSVFFPNKEQYDRDPLNTFVTLTHEFVHLWDSKEHGIWGFQRTYITPQLYMLIPLLAYGILGSALSLGMMVTGYLLAALIAYKSKIFALITFGASMLTALWFGWWASGLWVLLLPAAVGLLFLPSPARTRWEIRGYSMNIGVLRWVLNKKPATAYFDSMRNQFTGPNYLFMSWSKSKIEASLQEAMGNARSGAMQSAGPYKKVYEFLEKNDILADEKRT